ncbi:multidrug transporter AcrB [Solemya pervernicosa gill symbiont]|uniref:Multidrug transporter AcrB n=2 Tax=Gammaproteobacteria incertae sedis TaxID=118884 RepID=A0A1T2L4V4_9GAMM|nr:efflux RND transporter permease subunit [Candidatus Reidiella endopervernicosa]OOZ40137.1 multidrug transporter AcrB [Solemya pervernicosa gill symbiont]QKQ27451.1 efflux RND transporter permease subunit [Candidatus Reidiella endopervernicosa]
MSERLGISGSIAKKFLVSEITPLLALVGLLLGIFAVAITPREEEPQINVTFANVFIPYPGATAAEVEHLVSAPAEQVLSEIKGIKHVYSVSRPGMAVLTIQFKVGEDRTQAIVRLYNKIYSNSDWLPSNLGVGQPIIKPKGIDDVPIVSLTLWSESEQTGGAELQQVAHAIEAELKRVPGTRDIYTVGGPDRVVHLQLDVQKLAGYGVVVEDLQQALVSGNRSQAAGVMVSSNEEIVVQAGTFLSSAEEIGALVVAMHDGAPIYLNDVAEISFGSDQPERYVWFGTGPAADEKGIEARGEFPAVTVAIAKQPGSNAVDIADQVIERFEQLKGVFVPEGVNATVTRNYGATADDKAQTLIGKLIFATGFVVLLVLVALGRREAFIVGTAVVITLAITLFASWAWGFTLNRVSLFALIFSIGILVDDAIVVVENIHRHMQLGKRNLLESIPLAVDEVGGPTILATFTVIAALLPMAFVSGLMGPYMSPIPINASIGMVISLAVAFVVTPWLSNKVLANHHVGNSGDESDAALQRFFQRVMGPFLNAEQGRSKRRLLTLLIVVAIAGSVGLAGVKLVVLKMLPFDNKSEFQVVVDMPEGTTVEETAAVLGELGRQIATVPEVSDYQVYVGTASPIDFNGLIRQYYLRSGANVGDIQVNLVDKSKRDRKSHAIARGVREALQTIGQRYSANVKVVEVPPGPPVQSPLVAEVYGLDYQGQIAVAKQVRGVIESTADIVDVDDSVETEAPRLVVSVDRQKAAHLGVSQQAVSDLLTTALSGSDVGYLHGPHVKYAIPIRVEATVADKADIETLLGLKVRRQNGEMLPLSEIVSVQRTSRENAIYHKDLLPVVMVTADMAGDLDSPLYGMFDAMGSLAKAELDQGGLEQFLINQPANPYAYSIKWDGEWQVTYETFRDMGIAYSIGLILIYLLVVAQFRSYLVPLIIMAPIPLTIIGVMPGHALLGAQFTATSMIGMIALAGIIVRNSILLVDFVNDQVAGGSSLQQAVILAASVRAKPIILTGLAAMLGAFFILDDPIFSGLAISLIFGIFVSTLLTLLVIPVMYYALMYKRLDQQ